MAKRKAAVNDMIFELDNDDIVISSDEEGNVSKIGRFDGENSKKNKGKQINKEVKISDVINLDDSEHDITATIIDKNGGKNKSQVTSKQNKSNVNTEMNMTLNDEVIVITDEKKKSRENTIIFNEDIVIDSPASNTDLGVVGCENRAPLVSVRFNDRFASSTYKKVIKEFIVDLLKSRGVVNVDSETDNELEIWPEDLVEEEFDKVKENSIEDNLFFVDTTPGNDVRSNVPLYRAIKIKSNEPAKDTTSQTIRRGHTCFNCGESHLLKDCPKPRNNAKINERRKAFTPKGRYHVENEQKYGHLIPGRISAQLRHALGLKRNELPLHIYRMRLLGYPPGWLEEARISHSGITLFDSSGQATLGPDDDEGELLEPGSKDKFDIKKILDFPGFNVAASSRYDEEAHLFGLPEISEQDSKIAMLKILAPNAMEAYKRKKLSFFPSAQKNSIEKGQAEMELDSGDEVADFPAMPPLPDDEPPPLPPPPPPLPLTENHINKQEEQSNKHMELPKQKDELCSENQLTDIKNVSYIGRSTTDTICDGSNDLEVIEVLRVNDIPIPEDEFIVIDDDDDKSSLSSLSCGRISPSLDDLEKRKQKLLDALKGDTISILSGTSIDNNDSNDKGSERDEEIKSEVENKELAVPNENSSDSAETVNESVNESVKSDTTVSNVSSNTIQSNLKTGQIKNTEYGTPVINVASPYQKLPSDVNFAKDICDVINFENLPNSVGNYIKISSLLKKVKSEVDRIQDS